MKLVLLTHSRELERPSNTGKLVHTVLENTTDMQVCTVVWQRKQPCAQLLAQLATESWALLYPGSETVAACEVLQSCSIGSLKMPLNRSVKGLVLLDATWQEAQKMYNQSPYLHQLTKMLIEQTKPSVYRLRRNQKDYGLCTAECISAILCYLGLHSQAKQLLQDLEAMQQGLGR
ncbi:DTW domain-containing protein [Shewanella sp.]|uniref:DTW domain-containing protein n=1 Tax=Shewanella sp. TaxID=50422 RepID=UPI0040547F22